MTTMAIATPSLDDWDKLLWSLLSPDNTTRNQAEAVFAELKTQPDVVLAGLVQVVHSPRSDDVRGLAAVLLRRVLLRDAVSLWPTASAEVQTQVKEHLLQELVDEHNASIRRKVCDTIGELASGILEDGQWDTLVPTLRQWLEAPQLELREATLRVFEIIAGFLASQLEAVDVDGQEAPLQYEVLVFETIAQRLGDADGRIALHALRVLAMTLLNLESLLQLQRQELLETTCAQVLAALHRMLQQGHFDNAMEALEVLIEVAEPHADYFAPLLNEYVQTLVELADLSKNSAMPIPDGCRHLAMEMLVTIAENAARACRQLPRHAFVRSVLPVTFRFMLALDDIETWSETSCQDLEQNAMSDAVISHLDVGSEALERIVSALGARSCLAPCLTLIREFATRSDNQESDIPAWIYRHAALVALCQVLEHLKPRDVADATRLLLAEAQDAHPRVACTALDVLGQLAMDQAPFFQENYHAQTLPVLLNALLAFDRPRRQAHAATALRQFLDAASAAVAAPYLDIIVQHVQQVLTHEPSVPLVVLEQTLTALSSLATSAGAAFAPQYTSVMPLLHTLLMQSLQGMTSAAASTSSASNAFTLGGVTLECISLIGHSVGKDIMGADAERVLQVLAEMQQAPALSMHEALRGSLWQAWARLGACLGPALGPYLPLVMPSLLAAALQQAEVEVDPSQLNSDDDDSNSESSDGEDVELARVDDRCVRIRTAALEEKAAACELLAGLARDLEYAFFPYAEQVTQALAPLLTESVHPDLRAAAVHAMSAVVHCVTCAVQENQASLAALKQILDFAIGRLLHALGSEPELPVVTLILQSLAQCLQHIQTAETRLDAAQLQEVVQALLLALADSVQRRAVRRAERQAQRLEDAEEALEEGDQNDQEEWQDVEETSMEDEEDEEDENDATEEEIQLQLAECLGQLAKTHGPAFFPAFASLLVDKLIELSGAHCLATDRQFALFVLDDVIEHCGSPALSRLDDFVPLLCGALETCDGHPGVLQAAAYGVGVAARLGGDQFAPHAASCLQALAPWLELDAEMDNVPGLRSAVDNAVSALGLLCEHQATQIDVATLYPQWLTRLPLRGDLEESVQVLQRLCLQIDQRQASVLGNNGEHVVLLVRVLADAVAMNEVLTEAVGEEVTNQLQNQVAQTLKMLRAGVPPEKLPALWQMLSAPQQAAVQTLFV